MQSPKTTERLKTLRPDFKKLVDELLALGYANGLNPQVSSALRTPEEQDALYAVGRTRPGKVVTAAKRWQSAHNYGTAVDIFFLAPDGTADFSEAKYKKLDALAKAAGLYGKGMEWSGAWKTFREQAHWQVAGFDWKTYAKAAGVDPVTLRKT